MRDLSNRIYGAFDSVHAECELKEHTKQYLAQNSARRHVSPVRYAIAAAALLFVLAGGSGYAFYMTPVAAISIDINPSMEWEVNRLDRVVSVICYNEDAENVAENLHFKHRKYDEALKELLASREMSAYLSEDSTVNFSVASENMERSTRMQERAAECAESYCENVSCHAGSTEERRKANEAGVSLGKYQAFQILQESDADITLEEVSRMHMCQIRHRIEEYDDGDAGWTEDQDIEEAEEDTIEDQDVGSEGECRDDINGNHAGNSGHEYRHGHHHGYD